MKLNLGCAEKRITGYVNVDIRPESKADIICDVEDISTIGGYGTFESICASHILEHFCWDKTVKILKNWYHGLKKGGDIYVEVPDAEFAINLYVTGKGKAICKDGRVCDIEYLNHRIFGNADSAKRWSGDRYEREFHLAIFNRERLSRCLREAGFKQICEVTSHPAKGNVCQLSFAMVGVKE
jgi:predicted SAM-dependent methyltransferase